MILDNYGHALRRRVGFVGGFERQCIPASDLSVTACGFQVPLLLDEDETSLSLLPALPVTPSLLPSDR